MRVFAGILSVLLLSAASPTFKDNYVSTIRVLDLKYRSTTFNSNQANEIFAVSDVFAMNLIKETINKSSLEKYTGNGMTVFTGQDGRIEVTYRPDPNFFSEYSLVIIPLDRTAGIFWASFPITRNQESASTFHIIQVAKGTARVVAKQELTSFYNGHIKTGKLKYYHKTQTPKGFEQSAIPPWAFSGGGLIENSIKKTGGNIEFKTKYRRCLPSTLCYDEMTISWRYGGGKLFVQSYIDEYRSEEMINGEYKMKKDEVKFKN